MPARILETVLTGRNLLSPVLTGAAADVTAFDAKVTASQEKAATSAETSARAQTTAAERVQAANARTATSSSDAAAKVTAANTRSAESSTAASSKVVAANARAAESSRVFGDVTESSAARAHAAWSGLATKGLPLVAAALVVVTGKMAGDYQQLVTKLETTAGETRANLGMVSQGMLDMAGQVGISATELARGMYTVESAGYHGAAGLTVLKASAQGARQENADLAKVTDAVSTILHDYHLPASQAATVTSQLVTAVSHGKTTFDELTGSLHSVTPFASKLHVSLADITGTLSSMTASGESADQATQNMADTLRHLAGPTSTMTAELAQLGITSGDLSNDLGTKGLSGTLQLIEAAIVDHMDPATKKVLLPALNASKTAAADLKVMMGSMPPALAKASQSLLDGSTSITDYQKAAKGMGGTSGAMALQFLSLYKNSDGFNQVLKQGGPAAQAFTAAMAKSIGTSAGLNVMLQTTGENAAATNASIKDIGAATADTSGNIKGWSEVQGNFNQKLAQAGAEAKTLAIEAGQHLLPVLTGVVGWVGSTGLPAIGHLGSGIGDLVHGFSQLPGPVKTAAEALVLLNVAGKLGIFSTIGTQIVYARVLMAEFAATTSGSMATVSAAYRGAAVAAGELAAVQGSAALSGMASGIAGLGAAAGATAKVGFGALRSAGSGLVSLLGGPWVVGLAAAAGAVLFFKSQIDNHNASVKAATEDVKSWYGAMASKGGAEAVSGMNNIRSKTLELAAAQDKLKQMQEGGGKAAIGYGKSQNVAQVAIDAQKQHVKELSGELTKGKKEWDDYWASLTPQGKLDATLAADEANLAYAIQTTGTNSITTKNAVADYNVALGKQKELAGQVAGAEQTLIDKLQTLADVQLGAVSSSLATTQAQSHLNTALSDFAKGAANGTIKGQEYTDQSSALASQAIDTAKQIGANEHATLKAAHAADDGTVANQLMLQSLKDSAAHLTGPGHDALVKAYNDLLHATFATGNMSQSATNMGLNVVKTFDKNTAVVHGATAAQIADLQALGDKVTHLPDGNIIVTTDDHMARATLDALINDYNNKVVRVFTAAGQHISSATGPSGTVPKNAEGGHFRGAGTGTSDSNLSWLSDGEFIVKASQTAKHLPLLHAINDGSLPGYANGGPVGHFNMHAPLAADLSAQSIRWAEGKIAALASQAAAVGSAGGAPANVTGNAAIMQRVAAQYGWGSGPQWNDLYRLEMREAGFRNTAQNPTSSAYGMPQFLDSTWATVGVAKTSDPLFQSVGMMRYLAQRYGSPSAAWAHEMGYGWYQKGTPFVPNDGLAYLHRGERVVPAERNFTPTGAPGYAAATGGRTVVTVAAAPAPQVTVHFHVDGAEFRGMTRTEIDASLGRLADTIHYSS